MRALLIEIGLVLAVAVGVGVGYVLWGTPTNWYASVPTSPSSAPGPENDLIRYGRDLIVNTPRYIGKNATDPAMRYAGNDLACQNCHLNAGLQPFAAPFVSTFAHLPDDGRRSGADADRPDQRLHAAQHERQGLARREPRDGGADRLFQVRGEGHAGGRAHRRHGAQADRQPGLAARRTSRRGRSTPSIARHVTRRTARASRSKVRPSATPFRRSGATRASMPAPA